MDVHTKEQRSRNMSAIRGSKNRSTELAMLTLFRRKGIKNWRRYNRKLPGSPDFIFQKQKIAVFIDGCFWHGCSKHCIMPKSRVIFWKSKIRGNIKRDKMLEEIYENWDGKSYVFGSMK